MGCIEGLLNEHRLFERVIRRLGSFGEGATGSAEVRAELDEFVEVLVGLIDGLHHAKEEELLFPALAAHGMPPENGPVGVMLAEHDAGRFRVRQLREVAALRRDWTSGEAERLRDAAMGFADLLASHIHKEDQILYPMAQRILPSAVWAELDRQCDERDAAHHAERSRLVALAERLAGRAQR